MRCTIPLPTLVGSVICGTCIWVVVIWGAAGVIAAKADRCAKAVDVCVAQRLP